MELFKALSLKIKDKNLRIVYPEAEDVRVLGAAIRLKADKLIEPILIGNPDNIKQLAAENHWNLGDIEIIDPSNYPRFEEMVAAFFERRKGKNTEEQAREMLRDNVYLGTMLVYTDAADGLVCGATYSTGDTVRPALQIIKTRPNVKLTSGAFVMIPPVEGGGEKLIMADCAININPDAQELAEIAVESAKTARIFDIEPKVAMLSFSTKGSAASPEVDKVVEATRIARELDPTLPIDGELQFDAALVESVADKKAPESDVAGHANVFVFPEIQSGNIGYKIAQRIGQYQAIGPILQGLNKPVSDLSRGCNEEDVYKVSIITANQALI
ncbi:phosphate acetyltransferase [Falseniella ignava]|uniref:Phosphate acetyltransferase n=1 Tax=Falseniella ignava TaxID=137730 RepID=A0A2I1K594_9LACT|nr:phosphate acetyltransferase [Falseniella ignava]PKY90742.1 phosphate acetyltransferase [Falseniella ignava]